jgi:hypothetical protein
MSDNQTKGEMHGCIVCGKLYQLYVVYDSTGKFLDCKVMSAGGVRVPNKQRPLVACETHDSKVVEAAVIRVYGEQKDEED